MSQKSCPNYMKQTKSSQMRSDENRKKFEKQSNSKPQKSCSKPKNSTKFNESNNKPISLQKSRVQNLLKSKEQKQPYKRENYHKEKNQNEKLFRHYSPQIQIQKSSPQKIGKSIKNNTKTFQLPYQKQNFLNKQEGQKNPQNQIQQNSDSRIAARKNNSSLNMQNKNKDYYLKTPQQNISKIENQSETQQLTNKQIQRIKNQNYDFINTEKKKQKEHDEYIDYKEMTNAILNQKPQQPQKNQQPQEDSSQRLRITIEIVKKLVNISSNLRHVEQIHRHYLQQYGNLPELYSHYSIRQLQVKTNLKMHCNGILFVRGDGNCFYTAFGFEFLKILLTTYSDSQFNEFLNFIKQNQIKFKIYCKDFKIDDENIEKLLMQQFTYVLQQIRKIESKEERKNELYRQYHEYQIQDNGDGCFYCLATIFFRNLSNKLLDFSEMKDYVDDKQNLLIWETECNNNEIIISILAKYLKINVKLLFFNNGQFKLNEYESNQPNKIVLLIQPGHYNIGLQTNID